MEYRVNRRTGDRISALGMGTSAIASAGEAEGIETLRLAVENGINYFDLATAESVNFTTFGKALADVRDKVLYQVHFGAVYGEGRELQLDHRSGYGPPLGGLAAEGAEDRLHRLRLHPLPGRGRRLGEVPEKRSAGLPAGAEKGGGGAPHRPFLPHPGAGPPGAGHRPGGYAHVQHQPGLRLPARGVRQRQRRPAVRPVPPLPGGGGGRLGDEALLRRAAPGRQDLPLRRGSHRLPVPPVRPGPPRGPHRPPRHPGKGGPHAAAGVLRRPGGEAGLRRHQLPHPPGDGGDVRVL